MSLHELSDEELEAMAARLEHRHVGPSLGQTEHRSIAVADFEIRATKDSLALKGYASVFEHRYDIMGGPDKGGWTELVDRRAFDQTLKQRPDVHLLVNHDGTPLARTKSGTLDLSTDAKGLRVEAQLDPSSPTVQVIRSAMQRGDMDEMSFAFRTVRHDFNEETGERRLLEVNIHKGDVSIVNFGASDATSAQIRNATEALSTLAPDAALAELRMLRTVGAPRISVAEAERIIAAPRGD